MARYNEQQRDMAYRVYISDGVKASLDNLSAQLAGRGSVLTSRYIDLISNRQVEEDPRTKEEIVNQVFSSIV